MNRKLSFLGVLIAIVCCWTACEDDVSSAGSAVLKADDAIVVFVDTFPLRSTLVDRDSITSQADSFLLGEIETRYGTLRASIMTQLACPEGYSYPEGAVVDSICLFMYYASWFGDANSPMAIDAYLMDKKTFSYSGTYPTNLNINDYCSHEKTILTNHRIVVASEKLDSVQDSEGNYVPMLRMRVNDDFLDYFWSMQSFDTQENFNQQFKGILLESSFGSSTMLNISDIALGVFYHFNYSKAGRDTTVNDMKAFYANSEVRTVNHLTYLDKDELIESLRSDSDTYNYIIAPAGVYTRVTFPMGRIIDTILTHMVDVIDGEIITRRPYVNKAEVRIDVTNMYEGTESQRTSDDWLQPTSYMLLIKEESMDRFFEKRELPSDTCALLGVLTQGTDSLGDATYYYTYDLSDFIGIPLHEYIDFDSVRLVIEEELPMLLVPVSVNSSTSSTYNVSLYSSVRQQQTMSATQIRSAKDGMKFEIVYSGFSLPSVVWDEE